MRNRTLGFGLLFLFNVIIVILLTLVMNLALTMKHPIADLLVWLAAMASNYVLIRAIVIPRNRSGAFKGWRSPISVNIASFIGSGLLFAKGLNTADLFFEILGAIGVIFYGCI